MENFKISIYIKGIGHLYQCIDTNTERITNTVHYSIHTISYMLQKKFPFLTAGHVIIKAREILIESCEGII